MHWEMHVFIFTRDVEVTPGKKMAVHSLLEFAVISS